MLGKVAEDYFWHLSLPVTAMAIGAFATSTFLTKNSFLDEIRKQYVQTARMKGLSENLGALRPCVPQRHADRYRRFSGRLRQRLFTGSLLIEISSPLMAWGFCPSSRSSTATIRWSLPICSSSRCSALVVNLISDLI